MCPHLRLINALHILRIVFFVVYCVLTGVTFIYGIYGAITIDLRYIVFTIVYTIAYAAPFAQVLVFFVVMRAMCLSYDDWTTKMLAATATPLDHLSEVRRPLLALAVTHKNPRTPVFIN